MLELDCNWEGLSKGKKGHGGANTEVQKYREVKYSYVRTHPSISFQFHASPCHPCPSLPIMFFSMTPSYVPSCSMPLPVAQCPMSAHVTLHPSHSPLSLTAAYVHPYPSRSISVPPCPLSSVRGLCFSLPPYSSLTGRLPVIVTCRHCPSLSNFPVRTCVITHYRHSL